MNNSEENLNTIKGEVALEDWQRKEIRHVDVAILYGLGQKDRAHEVAKKLKPKENIDWIRNMKNIDEEVDYTTMSEELSETKEGFSKSIFNDMKKLLR